MATNSVIPIIEPDWTVRVFRPILISALVTCMVAGWVVLFQLFLPNWQGDYISLLAFFATLETLIAEQQLRARHAYLTSRAPVRVAEFGLVLLLLKPASFLGRGWEALWANARTWLIDPGSFLTGEYVFGALLLVLVWVTALDISSCLAMLDDWRNPEEQTPALENIKFHFVWGGFLLLAAVGLRHIAATLLQQTTSLLDSQLWLPLVYFGLGLLLLSQARLALLRSTWVREQVSTDPRLGGRWAIWGALFVAGVIVLALLFPSIDTIVGFYIFAWLLYVVSTVFQIIAFILLVLFSMLATPCLTLFQVEQHQIQPPALSPPPAPPPHATGEPIEFFYLRLAIFWLAVLVVILFLLRTYWRDRQAIGGWKIWNALLLWWRGLWAWLRRWKNQVEGLIRRPVIAPALTVPGPTPYWWDRWRARTARERVRRLYLALVQRAAQAGHPRRPSQTPFEYAEGLESHLASEREALETLTEAFVQARYSPRPFSTDEVGLLHRLWQRLAAALRHKRMF